MVLRDGLSDRKFLIDGHRGVYEACSCWKIERFMHSRPVSGHDRFLDFVYGYVAQIADIDPAPMETII